MSNRPGFRRFTAVVFAAGFAFGLAAFWLLLLLNRGWVRC